MRGPAEESEKKTGARRATRESRGRGFCGRRVEGGCGGGRGWEGLEGERERERERARGCGCSGRAVVGVWSELRLQKVGRKQGLAQEARGPRARWIRMKTGAVWVDVRRNGGTGTRGTCGTWGT